jgi:hypothetical protein
VHGTNLEGYCQVDTVAARHARSHLLLGAKRVGTRGDGYVCPQGIHSTPKRPVRESNEMIHIAGTRLRLCGDRLTHCQPLNSSRPSYEVYSDPKADSFLLFKRQAMYWLLFVRVTPARYHVRCSLSYAPTKAAQDANSSPHA